MKLLYFLYQVPVETYEFKTVNILLSTLVVVLIGAIIYLDKQNRQLTKEHKEDLKLFDGENKKLTNELFDILNKFYLSLEEGKLVDEDTKKKLDRIILLIESLKDK